MKTALPLLFTAAMLAGCSKNTPAPASLLGTWNEDSWQYALTHRNGTPSNTITVAPRPNRPGLSITADTVHFLLQGTNAGLPARYSYHDSTLDLRPNYNLYIVKALTAHQLILVSYDGLGQDMITDTYTYSR